MRTRKETAQRDAGHLERVARALYSVCVAEEPLANLMQVLHATTWRTTEARDVAGGAGFRRLSPSATDYADWSPAVTLLNNTAQDSPFLLHCATKVLTTWLARSVPLPAIPPHWVSTE